MGNGCGSVGRAVFPDTVQIQSTAKFYIEHVYW